MIHLQKAFERVIEAAFVAGQTWESAGPFTSQELNRISAELTDAKKEFEDMVLALLHANGYEQTQ